MSNQIRNFCIIAHIDHGKSTLADRFLELTHQVPLRKMREQYLDQMELEREKGITIKLQPVRMHYQGHELNLIDTPGHVDFNYEVSRSLAAVEGAILLVDATQGIQAQTLGNLYLALEHNLAIIPAINKIDLPNAEIKKTKQELAQLLGIREEEVSEISAKSGQGVESLLDRAVKEIPAPVIKKSSPLKALIFDSEYNEYKGVVAYLKVVEGQVEAGQKVELMADKKQTEALEVGFFNPQLIKDKILTSGQIGYLVTGLKELGSVKVGDTITLAGSKIKPLPGYREVKPMVFASLYPSSGEDYPKLRQSVEKLKLNDASLIFSPEHLPALGFGFRCGFLGLLHLEIIQERLKREYGLNIVTTVPSVAYHLYLGEEQKPVVIHSAEEWPDPSRIKRTEEPWVNVDILSPKEYLGDIFKLVTEYGGHYQNTEYLNFSQGARVLLHYELPLASILVDFYDKLKSVSSGFASLNYEFVDYRPTEIEKVDILVASEKVAALSTLIKKSKAYEVSRRIVDTLKETLPRQQFAVKVQAAIGGKIIAASELKALRKDVTAKLYGGDVSRKKKLLEKQKKGKKKMKALGKVEIPTDVYLKVLRK